MPTRRKNEIIKKYIKRCVPEGRNKKQALGKCYGMAKRRKKR